MRARLQATKRSFMAGSLWQTHVCVRVCVCVYDAQACLELFMAREPSLQGCATTITMCVCLCVYANMYTTCTGPVASANPPKGHFLWCTVNVHVG